MTITSLKKPLKILQLDSDAKFANELMKLLVSEGMKVEVELINSRKQLNNKLKESVYDLIFLADNAQDCSGVDALKAVKKIKVYTPVLVFSDILEEETIVNYINLGAVDYILKTSLHRLASVVRRIISNSRNSGIVDYQNFFENSLDLMCTCDGEGHFIGINQAWGKLTGYTDAELIDKAFIEFVFPEDQKSAAAQFQNLFDSKSKSSDLLCRFQTATGEIKWLHWKMKIQTNGNINAVVRDVTESKMREIQLTQAHNNLQKLNELYKADLVKKTLVADQIRDSVVVTDLRGHIVSWNKGSEKIFGYTPEEAMGQHIAMIYPEKDYKYIQEEASNVLLEQGEKEFELHMRRKSGEVFEARLALEVARDNEGKVNGMLGYAIDMGPVRAEDEENAKPEQMQTVQPIPVDEQQNTNSQEEPVVINEAVVEEEVKIEPEPELSEEVVVAKSKEKPVEDLQKEQAIENESAEDKAIEAVEMSENSAISEDKQITQKVFVPALTGSGVTIMYLEDSLTHINQVEKILAQRKDYRLITTQEPEDCVDMARQYLPSLILLDMNLPDTDVYALLRQLHADGSLKHIPVVAVGADLSIETKETARQAGFMEYLVKPVENDSLLQVIDSIFYADSSKAIGNAS